MGQLETRTALVGAIALYADKMQALATGNDDVTLGYKLTEARGTAIDTGKECEDHSFA